jgi:hypothetical protein
MPASPRPVLALAVCAWIALSSAACGRPANASATAKPAVSAGATGGLASAEALRLRLRAGGRGSAAFTQRLIDPLGPSRGRGGRLALEHPGLVRIEFRDDGECLTLRRDGGEWLQPSLGQLVLLPADQLGAAARVWDVLLGGTPTGVSERRVSARTYLLTADGGDAAAFDSVWVSLDPRGLPARIEAGAEGQRVVFEVSGWTFGAARGVAAFTQVAPKGVATVPMR